MIDNAFGSSSSGITLGYRSSPHVLANFENITIPPGATIFAEVVNLATKPLLIEQLLDIYIAPTFEKNGVSRVRTTAYLNPNTFGAIKTGGTTKVLSNTLYGKTSNIKGFLVDVLILDTFDIVVNDKCIILDTRTVSYSETTDEFATVSGSKKFNKPISVPPKGSVVIGISNTGIDVVFAGGTKVDLSLTISGQYLTNSDSLPTEPLTVDSTNITVDDTDVTVDQTKL